MAPSFLDGPLEAAAPTTVRRTTPVRTGSPQRQEGAKSIASAIQHRDPTLKPLEEPTRVEIGVGTLTEMGNAIIHAMAAGSLSPAQAASMLAALGSLSKIQETDELERRIAALEARKRSGGT